MEKSVEGVVTLEDLLESLKIIEKVLLRYKALSEEIDGLIEETNDRLEVICDYLASLGINLDGDGEAND